MVFSVTFLQDLTEKPGGFLKRMRWCWDLEFGIHSAGNVVGDLSASQGSGRGDGEYVWVLRELCHSGDSFWLVFINVY